MENHRMLGTEEAVVVGMEGGPGPTGIPGSAQSDPDCLLMSRQQISHSRDAAVFAAFHGEPLQRERRPGTGAQKMFETLNGARDVTVDECDPDAGVYRKPAVLPGGYAGGRRAAGASSSHVTPPPRRGVAQRKPAVRSRRERPSVRATTAWGPSARNPRSRVGTEITHCRTGGGGD